LNDSTATWISTKSWDYSGAVKVAMEGNVRQSRMPAYGDEQNVLSNLKIKFQSSSEIIRPN
jgi:hypothetical protein